MQIHVNGRVESFDERVTIAALLGRFDLTPQRVAVEVNERLVRRADFDQTPLEDGDRVEIVTLVGGG